MVRQPTDVVLRLSHRLPADLDAGEDVSPLLLLGAHTHLNADEHQRAKYRDSGHGLAGMIENSEYGD